ncbi:MAG: 23S rRNA (pseudouridine(1915)-N(3))-methyltransferase RlmH, partial [Pseudomonadota bacterium]
MQLHIIARVNIGRSPEAELVERYLKRITWPTRLTELSERAPMPAAPSGSVTVLLDEKGDALSSMELARKLE